MAEEQQLKIFYRISEAGYNKVKPDYINNENCLANFVKHFDAEDITVVADNVSEETLAMIYKYVPKGNVQAVTIANGAGTFNYTFQQALKLPDETIVYFVENDYLHRKDAKKVLLEAFNSNVSFVTLYDHPDKYIDPSKGGNKLSEGGGESTRVYRSDTCHWKITNSTTMTFAGRVKSLKEDRDIINFFTSGRHPESGEFTGHPYDFSMWLTIRERNHILISPIPSYSTHGETVWLAPFINWEDEL